MRWERILGRGMARERYVKLGSASGRDGVGTWTKFVTSERGEVTRREKRYSRSSYRLTSKKTASAPGSLSETTGLSCGDIVREGGNCIFIFNGRLGFLTPGDPLGWSGICCSCCTFAVGPAPSSEVPLPLFPSKKLHIICKNCSRIRKTCPHTTTTTKQHR